MAGGFQYMYNRPKVAAQGTYGGTSGGRPEVIAPWVIGQGPRKEIPRLVEESRLICSFWSHNMSIVIM